MNNDLEDVKKSLSLKNIVLTFVIGIAFLAFLIYRDPKFTMDNFLLLKNINVYYFLGAIGMVIVRDFFYILRIRLLVKNDISYLNCFIIIALWEFSSCVTPTAVGGGFIAVFLFLHEGISVGRAIAYVMITATFDNYFFLLFSPTGFLMSDINSPAISGLYVVSYCLILLYSSIMTCSVFIKPEILRFILMKITSIPFLRRFRENAIQSANDMVSSSKILKKYGIKFWIVVLFVTFVAWCSRYLVLNFLVNSFINQSVVGHFDILGRHLILWVTMLVSPTPGGAGLVEYIFNEFYHDILNDYTIIIVILWRVLTFYLYMFMGILLLPNWIKTFKFDRKKRVSSSSDDNV